MRYQDTSREAYRRAGVKMPETKRRIVACVRASEPAGMTTKAVEWGLGLPHETVSATVSALVHEDRVLRYGPEKVRLATGRMAYVLHIAKPAAADSEKPKAPEQGGLFNAGRKFNDPA